MEQNVKCSAVSTASASAPSVSRSKRTAGFPSESLMGNDSTQFRCWESSMMTFGGPTSTKNSGLQPSTFRSAVIWDEVWKAGNGQSAQSANQRSHHSAPTMVLSGKDQPLWMKPRLNPSHWYISCGTPNWKVSFESGVAAPPLASLKLDLNENNHYPRWCPPWWKYLSPLPSVSSCQNKLLLAIEYMSSPHQNFCELLSVTLSVNRWMNTWQYNGTQSWTPIMSMAKSQTKQP